jgi:histidine triad (HIT) family protein
MACLFCKIASKEIPAKIFYEDEQVVAFLDIAPRSLGHAVAILKKHAPTLLELADSDLAALFAAVKKVDGLLAMKLQPDGMTIGVNQGKASGQEVDHLHVHLIPRWHNDGGGSIQSVVSNSTSESLEEIAKKLRL